MHFPAFSTFAGSVLWYEATTRPENVGKKKFLLLKQMKNLITLNQNFYLKYKLLDANTTQKTKMVKGGFAFSFKHYAREYIDF